MDKITRKQFMELCDATIDRTKFNELLEEYTGIEAKSYTGYQYFDGAGNYIGDTDYNTLDELLENAYIQIVDEE